MGIELGDDVVTQVVNRIDSRYRISSMRTLSGLLLSSLQGVFLNSFAIAWVIEIITGRTKANPFVRFSHEDER